MSSKRVHLEDGTLGLGVGALGFVLGDSTSFSVVVVLLLIQYYYTGTGVIIFHVPETTMVFILVSTTGSSPRYIVSA